MLRQVRREGGLCEYCGGELNRDGRVCSKCLKLNNKQKMTHKVKALKSAKCSNCFKPLDRHGWFCTECAKALAVMAKERYNKRRAAGLCIQCAEPTTGMAYCRSCLDKLKARRILAARGHSPRKGSKITAILGGTI